jgi:CPA2 family monovalent cation:H+ antiporter-2
MDEVLLISSMAILIILAAFLSIVMHKIKFPPLVGFLAAGILIANFIELPEEADEVVEIFSNLGLILLMFCIGMEIDLPKLKTIGRFALVVTLFQLPLMVLAGYIAGIALGFNMVQSICLGAIISGSSTAVALAVLKSQGILSKDHIEILVLIMVMEDIGQVIMMSMLTPLMSGGSLETSALIVLIIQIAVFMIVCFTVGLFVVPRIINWFYERANDELISLLCIGALFTLSWAATKMGLSVAIGAFLMGIIVAASKPKEAVESYVKPLESLFMAMFFISVGMEVSLGSLADNIVMVFVIFGVFVVFKTATVYLGYWVGDGNSRVGFISAVSLCAMGEFAFIIAKQALDAGAVDSGYYSSVIGAALISMIMLPVLTKYSGKVFDTASAKCPEGLSSRLAAISARRDVFYQNLRALPGLARDKFSKGVFAVYFNILLIIIIEILFHYLTRPAMDWAIENLGMDSMLASICILALNFIILAYPCITLMNNLRIILFVLYAGKKKADNLKEGTTGNRLHETMNPLILAGALDIVIILTIPDGFSPYFELAIGVVVVGAVILHQYWKLKHGKPGKRMHAKADKGAGKS